MISKAVLRTWRRWVLAVAIDLSPQFLAQDAAAASFTHDRFYLRGALGLGVGRLSGNWEPEGLLPDEAGESKVRASGVMPQFQLFFGGTPRRGLVVGGGASGSTAINPNGRLMGYALEDFSGSRFHYFDVFFFTDYFLNPQTGFHLLGLVGPGGVAVGSPNLRYRLSAAGLSFGAGVGYDFWVGSELSVGPLLSLRYAFLSGDDVPIAGGCVLGSLGIAITVH